MTTPVPNDRFEGVVAELAQVINEEHYWDCDHEERDSGCGHDRARAVLAYLRPRHCVQHGGIPSAGGPRADDLRTCRQAQRLPATDRVRTLPEHAPGR